MPHLLVHQTLMRAKFEADAAEDEEDVIVVALGLEGVTVQEFVLAGKGKGLESSRIFQRKSSSVKNSKLWLGYFYFQSTPFRLLLSSSIIQRVNCQAVNSSSIVNVAKKT